MAASNQGHSRRNEGQEKNNTGGSHSKQSEPQNMAQNIQAGAEQVGNRVREQYDSAKDGMARGYRSAEGTVARNPSSSILIGFGLGFGLGLVMTTLLTRREETWADRYMPDSLRDLKMPDGLSRAASHVPGQLHHSFHHLADSIRDLPSAIAKMIPSR